MKNNYIKEQQRETIAYLFFGVLTVLVNILTYKMLKFFMGDMLANTLAFFIAVLFAYWTNSTYVFKAAHTWHNFSQFILMRIATLFIDDGGMYLLLLWQFNDVLAKIIVNFIVIVINYLMSKLIVFR